MQRWKWCWDSGADPRVVEVACEAAGYPHCDADGLIQTHQTHFDSEREAWDFLRTETEAEIDRVIIHMRSLEKQLEAAQVELLEASAKNSTVRRCIRSRWGKP